MGQNEKQNGTFSNRKAKRETCWDKIKSKTGNLLGQKLLSTVLDLQ